MFKRTTSDILKLKEEITNLSGKLKDKEVRSYLRSKGFSYPTVKKYMDAHRGKVQERAELEQKVAKGSAKLSEIEEFVKSMG